ncbi:iron-containing alcohol dehydrogenase [Salsuginibacillus kocurii]|uniref:iron-containing alcohol dehydrogenase n=1 Tax=Salsuginibacillus kocurii TaxID=427078 RepID=UPI000380C97D|nr:iron-containing alcohol dehydrogenase [Salsuginibacillus kocurii]
MNINKFMTPEIIFGKDALEQTGESFKRLGANKVLVVSDKGVVEAGWSEKALANIRQAGLDYAEFYQLSTNPKDEEVRNGAAVYINEYCDAVFGLGGGSPMDVAKAVAIIVTNQGNIRDYEGVDQITRPLPPLIMASTTAGSGSEVSQFSVVVDTEKQKKMTIVSKSLVPDIAIVDPQLLMTKDPLLTAATGMDVLTHSIEAYVSIAATPLTDVQAKNAIKLVSEYLRPSVASASNEEAKRAMAMASLQAGLAFSNAILGAIHAMSHAIGGKYALAHGEINAVLLPHVMEYNLIANPKRFRTISELMGTSTSGLTDMEAANTSVQMVRKLLKDIGAPQQFSDLGFQEQDFVVMAEVALEDACMITNPRDLSVEEVVALFKQAL